MARQRVIHPNFWSSSKLKKLFRQHGAEAVLFYCGLFSNADDAGRGSADFDWLDAKMPILRLDPGLVTNWLETSNELVLVQLYSDKNFYFIPDWFEKQKIPKPYPSEFPLPEPEQLDRFNGYTLELLAQLNNILQRFKKEKRVTNQLVTSIKLVKNQLQTSSPMKLKERKLKEVKGKEVKSYCSEPEKSDSEPILLTIPLIKRDGEFNIYQEDIDQWQDTFPAINALQQVKAYKQWAVDSPTRRKTRVGIRKSISGWLGRAQDKASSPATSPKGQQVTFAQQRTIANLAAADQAVKMMEEAGDE